MVEDDVAYAASTRSAPRRGAAELGAAPESANDVPLVVDLDGTLVSSDLLAEGMLALLKRAPVAAVRLLGRLLANRAAGKRELALRLPLDAATLPYREELCSYLRDERRRGRRLVLATANDESWARAVAHYLGLFERVVASDGVQNCKGAAKRERLVAELGENGFDYAGDARADLPVWEAARGAVIVGGSRLLRAAVERRTAVRRHIDTPTGFRPLPALRALRAHHWLKNLLLFVAPLAALRWEEPGVAASTLRGFASFCLLASAGYVLNDLLDVSSDRRHPRKRLRPIPAGQLPLAQAAAMTPLLGGAGFAIAWGLPARFLGAAALYCAATFVYSLKLKDVVLLDVMVLAGLYLLRVVAGGAASGTPVSHWLLEVSLFVFLSLAVLKRYTEIVMTRVLTNGGSHVRGYRPADAVLLLAMGIASGYLAALTVALYADSSAAASLYARPELLWLACPVLVYWISHLWLVAERNRVIFDPVVFAIRDRTSQLLLAIVAGLVWLAL